MIGKTLCIHIGQTCQGLISIRRGLLSPYLLAWKGSNESPTILFLWHLRSIYYTVQENVRPFFILNRNPPEIVWDMPLMSQTLHGGRISIVICRRMQMHFQEDDAYVAGVVTSRYASLLSKSETEWVLDCQRWEVLKIPKYNWDGFFYFHHQFLMFHNQEKLLPEEHLWIVL